MSYTFTFTLTFRPECKFVQIISVLSTESTTRSTSPSTSSSTARSTPGSTCRCTDDSTRYSDSTIKSTTRQETYRSEVSYIISLFHSNSSGDRTETILTSFNPVTQKYRTESQTIYRYITPFNKAVAFEETNMRNFLYEAVTDILEPDMSNFQMADLQSDFQPILHANLHSDLHTDLLVDLQRQSTHKIYMHLQQIYRQICRQYNIGESRPTHKFFIFARIQFHI